MSLHSWFDTNSSPILNSVYVSKQGQRADLPAGFSGVLRGVSAHGVAQLDRAGFVVAAAAITPPQCHLIA